MNQRFTNINRWVWGVGISVLLLWLCTPKIVESVSSACGIEQRGQYGDMFGYINSLFTGFTIIGLVYTILLQRHEIEMNKLDAIENREELKRQKKSDAYKRFENRFFMLLSLHQKLYDDLKTPFARFEHDIITANFSTLDKFGAVYREKVEVKHVLKNFGNYLDTFNIIISEIMKKKTEKARIKYLTIYFAQLHVNEKRFFLYHFTFGEHGKPTEWAFVRTFLFKGFDRKHIDLDEFRNFDFTILER